MLSVGRCSSVGHIHEKVADAPPISDAQLDSVAGGVFGVSQSGCGAVQVIAVLALE